MRWVEAIDGEVLRFRVKSRSVAGFSYLVDLQALKGNGQCGCDQFLYRCAPALVVTKEPCYRTRCWHITKARDWLLDQFIDRLADRNGNAKQERRMERIGP